MKEEKETRKKLLLSAKKEFLEKGYNQASLRTICRNAGVTTGALYFFFQDKEDLFGELVKEPLEGLYQLMKRHYEGEAKEADGVEIGEEYVDDYETTRLLVRFIYQYYDECFLLVAKSQGSRYENCIEQFVTVSEQHYRYLAERMEERIGKKVFDDYTLHWFAHMQTDAFVHLLTHERSEEAALKHMDKITKYMLSGWNGMFR